MATTVRADVARNRLYIILDGAMGEEESKANLPKINQEAKKLQMGFSVITDVTGCKPTSLKVKEAIESGQADLLKLGVKHVVRVVGKNSISAMQLDNGAKATYTGSVKVDIVATMADAERLLNH